MRLEGLKINFLGDSITEGHGASSPEFFFWKRFEKDGCICRGYGIGGTRIANQQVPYDERMDQYFASRVDAMDNDADVVVIFGGTNDYGHGDAAKGCMTDRTPDTFYGALHDLYQKILKKYPKATVIVMTPLHRTDENRVYNERGIRNWGTLSDYVEIIREVAQYYSLPVVDLYKESGIQPQEDFLRERYCPDGLHPNDAGNEIIYRCLKSRLMQLGN